HRDRHRIGGATDHDETKEFEGAARRGRFCRALPGWNQLPDPLDLFSLKIFARGWLLRGIEQIDNLTFDATSLVRLEEIVDELVRRRIGGRWRSRLLGVIRGQSGFRI